MIGGVTSHMLPHLSGVPHLHVNRLVYIKKYRMVWYFNLHLIPHLDFQEMTSILILANFKLVSRLFDRIHLVYGFHLQLKIF